MKYLFKMPFFCGNKIISLISYFQPRVRKETLGLNFISTACALHSSTAGDGDIPAVQWDKRKMDVPAALPERCDELQDCDS